MKGINCKMGQKYSPKSAAAALKEAGAEPLESYPNNMAKKWKCHCLSCGKTIYPRMVNIESGKACRYCFGPTPVKEAEAVNIMLKAGVEPLEPYPGYDKRWLVRCKTCGGKSKPQYKNILKGQGGCFRCGSDYGDMPAFVYLVHHKAQRVIKVGITNQHAHRLKKYPGWTLVDTIRTNTGNDAARIEAEILRCWRFELGLDIKISRGQMPNKGYTETADEVGLEASLRILEKYKIK